MSEDNFTNIVTEFFNGGWRMAPFIKTPDGYMGVKAWPKRAAKSIAELQLLIKEQKEKSSRPPIFGVVPPNGRYVVDIDTKKNTSAFELWRDKVIEACGDETLANPNLVVKTKSGGLHLYYSDGSDKPIRSPVSVFGKDSGIDIRGCTGMVVAPTSYGTDLDWSLGEYMIIKGRPTDPLTVLGLSKILGDSYDETDSHVRQLLMTINEILRNDLVNEYQRSLLIPNDLVIPSSSRDNTLYRCSRLCRLAGLSQEAAIKFMTVIGSRCEATEEEPIEHWIELGITKVRRVYATEAEMRIKSISNLYEELDNAGTVLLRGISKSYYYFRHGSKLLRLDPRSKFSTDNIGNVLQGVVINGEEDGQIPAKKVVSGYSPREVAYSDAMYPKTDIQFFDYDGIRYVNSYFDPFAAFEPSPELLEKAAPYVQRFADFARHITGYNDSDDVRLLDKLAWIVQKPYRRMPTGTIIYSHTRGSGKDSFMLLVREIVGRRYYMPITLQSIESAHTILHDKLICVASEVQLQTNARGTMAAAGFMGKIKDLITTKTVMVDEKFVQAYNAPIFANFFLLSNFELSSILEPGDRRFDVFHAAEEKMDQSLFGNLADVGNDGVWVERSATDQMLRKHIVYSIRMALKERTIDAEFDRQEAVMNEVKRALMESQNPPQLDWMLRNLPAYFTEDVAMMACFFCPMRSHPEYIMKQLKEHFGPRMMPIYRSGSKAMHRMNGSPKLTMRTDGNSKIPTLDFDVKTADQSARRSVYTFDRTVRDAFPNDWAIKNHIRRWYESMLAQFYGNVKMLPNQKPESAPDLL